MKKFSFDRNIFAVGLLSFFGGMSQDMFVPVLPLYLSGVLHLDASFIGLSAGVVTASASLFKIIAGFWSDKTRSRKSIVFFGYSCSLIGRLLLAFFSSAFAVLGLRFLDGAGKGIKDSPKDALIADSTKHETRGKGFGIVRALDTFGSVAGPLMLFCLLYLWRTNALKYHYIFLATAVPLVATLLIIIFLVKETSAASSSSSPAVTTAKLPKKFYLFLVVMAIFSLGNSSDAFLLLRAQNLGVTVLSIPLVYALFNFFYAGASIPLGSLSDKIGREKVILIGWVCYALAYLGFAFATKSYEAWLLFAFYGIYYATTEGVAKALIADIVGTGARGRAYGIYNAVVGLMALPASYIAGVLWDKVNPAAPFWFGAGVAGLAVMTLLFFTKKKMLR